MLEHNYLIRKDKNSLQLGGVVIGLALNSVYYYRENIGDPQQEVTIDSSKNSKKLLAEGEKLRNKSLNAFVKWTDCKSPSHDCSL